MLGIVIFTGMAFIISLILAIVAYILRKDENKEFNGSNQTNN